MGSTEEDPMRVRKGEGGEVSEPASSRSSNVAGRSSGNLGRGTVINPSMRDQIHGRVNHLRVGSSHVPANHVCNNYHGRDIGSSWRRNCSAGRGSSGSTTPCKPQGSSYISGGGGRGIGPYFYCRGGRQTRPPFNSSGVYQREKEGGNRSEGIGGSQQQLCRMGGEQGEEGTGTKIQVPTRRIHQAGGVDRGVEGSADIPDDGRRRVCFLYEVQRQDVGVEKDITYEIGCCVTGGRGNKKGGGTAWGGGGCGSGNWRSEGRSRQQKGGGAAGWGDGWGNET